MRKAQSRVNELRCDVVYSIRVIMDNDFDPSKLQKEVRSRTRRAVQIERDIDHPARALAGYAYKISAAKQGNLDVFCGALIAIEEDVERVQEMNRIYALLSK